MNNKLFNTLLLIWYVFICASASYAETVPSSRVNSRLQDGAGNAITSSSVGAKRALDVSVAEMINQLSNPLYMQQVVSGSVIDPRARTWALNQGTDSVTAVISGTIPVSLPAGLATSALQTTGNSTLSSIDAKTPTFGQKTSANSVPVVISSDQSPIAVTGTFSTTLPAGGATLAEQQAQTTKLTSIDNKLSSPMPVSVNNFPAVQSVSVSNASLPVTVASLPLPAGAATATKQDQQSTSLNNIDTKLTTTANGVKVDATVTSSVLPTGASTSALQTTGNASLSSIDSKTPALVLGKVPVDTGLSPLTDAQLRAAPVPVSGSFSIPGVATSAKQDIGNASLASIDSKLTGPLSVTTTNPGLTDTQLRASPVTVNGAVGVTNFPAVQNVNVVTAVLPTGAASNANQVTANGILTSIDGKLTSPITVTQSSQPLPTGAATESTLSSVDTKLTTTANGLKVDGSAVTQPVSGPLTDTQLRASPVAVSGSVSVSSSALPTGAATESTLASRASEATLSSVDGKIPANLTVTATRLLVDGSGVTQPVSAASLPLPTGAATSALQGTANASLASIDSKLTSPLTVTQSSQPLPTGAATESTLSSIDTKVTTTANGIRVDGSATTQPVSGTVSVSNFPATQPVSAVSLPLPTGASTSANQTTGNASLSSIDGKLNSLGQKTMANSTPVVISSDQTAVPASQSGTWNINNVSGTVSLPTGAATAANQTTANNSLSSIDGKITPSTGSYANIKAAGTVTLKSGAGRLLRVCTNTNNGNGHTLTAYDNTTGAGTTITTITTSGGTAPGTCANYDLNFATGLTIVTSNTSNFTVVYQ